MTLVKAVVMKDGHIDVKRDKDGKEISRRLARKGEVVEVDNSIPWYAKQIARGDLDTKAVQEREAEERRRLQAEKELAEYQRKQAEAAAVAEKEAAAKAQAEKEAAAKQQQGS